MRFAFTFVSQVSDPRWSETAWAKKMKAKASNFGCVWEVENLQRVLRAGLEGNISLE